MNARRGYVPGDERDFSPEGIRLLCRASRHVRFLLNEGYDLKSSATFVGNHFQLSERQRLALMRCAVSDREKKIRAEKERTLPELCGAQVNVDGFNQIITLEVMLCRSPLFTGGDGAVRDLAALRGTYRIIPETVPAVKLLLSVLQDAGISGAEIFLDEPVSNSGRLLSLIADQAEKTGFPVHVSIARGVDRILWGLENVVTSDSIILNRCLSWVNVMKICAEKTGAPVLQIAEPESSA